MMKLFLTFYLLTFEFGFFFLKFKLKFNFWFLSFLQVELLFLFFVHQSSFNFLFICFHHFFFSDRFVVVVVIRSMSVSVLLSTMSRITEPVDKIALVNDYVEANAGKRTVNMKDLILIVKKFDRNEKVFRLAIMLALLRVECDWINYNMYEIVKLLATDSERVHLCTALIDRYKRDTTYKAEAQIQKCVCLIKNVTAAFCVYRMLDGLFVNITFDVVFDMLFIYKASALTSKVLLWYCASARDHAIRLNSINTAITTFEEVLRLPFESDAALLNVARVLLPMWAGPIHRDDLMDDHPDIRKELDELLPKKKAKNNSHDEDEDDGKEKEEDDKGKGKAECADGSSDKNNGAPMTCSICLDRHIATVVIPCNHSYACVECIRDPTNVNNLERTCSICRQSYERVIELRLV